MFGVLIYDVLFFAVPLAFLLLFGISLYRYISAKRQNKRAPGTFSPSELKRRKVFLIVSSVIAGILLAVVIGFTVLLFLAIAYM